MINTVKKLIEILPSKDKFKLFILFCMMLFAGFLEALSIGIIAGFVGVVANPDILLEIEFLFPLLRFLEIETSRDVLIYGSAFLIILFLLKNAYIIFFKYTKVRFIINRYRTISDRLFNLYMNVPYSFHLKRNSADLIRNVTTEVRFLTSYVMMPFLQIAAESIMTLGIVILLFFVEPLMTFLTIIILGGITFFFLKTTKKNIKKYGEKTVQERGKIIKTVNEGIGGFKDAKIMGRQEWFINKFEENVKVLSKAEIFKNTIDQIIRPVIETIAVIGMLVIALIFLQQGHSIAYLVSILALFALSIQRLLPAVNKIVSEYTKLKYHSYSINPIYKDLTSFKTSKKDNGKKLHLKEKIEVENVSYNYPDSKEEVLKNVSLSVFKGSAVGFVGSTGSGKTTLVDLILGLIEPTKGKILIDGKDIKENVSSWQRNIGYIPQFIYLSDDTIKNNIAFGLKEIDEEKLKKAIKASQLEEFIKRLPKGTNTFIGERGIRLSGGQRQRIGIARALYNNPEILIMDEATSSLDNITERFVIKAIERLKKERTVIIIAHRLTTVKNCDNLYLLKEGKIIEEGKYNDLLSKNGDFKLMADSS